MAGQREQGLEILHRRHDGLLKLGLADQAQRVSALIEKIRQSAGPSEAGERKKA